MKSGTMFVLLILLAGGEVFANGGPFDTSMPLVSGNISFLQETDILLRSEHLTIVPVGDWIEVHAVYVLENTGPARSVEYAFPIEVDASYYAYYYSTSSKEPSVSLLDGALPLPLQILSFPEEEEAPVLGNSFVPGIDNWYTTTLSFQPGETKTLSAHCRIMAGYEDFSNTKYFPPSYCSRRFQYRLDPAGYWGCGTADTFQYAIDFSWVLQNGGMVDSISGPGEWLSESVFGLTQPDFSLDSAPVIRFEYSIDRWKLAELIENYALRRWHVSGVSVSSELPDQEDHDYKYRNLFDGDLSTAWVEGASGDGTGEWIQVDLPENFDLGSIGIINGYQSSQEAYESNGRAAQVRCTIDFADGSSTEFSEDIEDQSWEEVTADPCRGFTSLWDAGWDGKMYEVAVRVRLEILGVHPGHSYNDLCISEFIILGFPHGLWDW